LIILCSSNTFSHTFLADESLHKEMKKCGIIGVKNAKRIQDIGSSSQKIVITQIVAINSKTVAITLVMTLCLK
jgi:hypothetical protein